MTERPDSRRDSELTGLEDALKGFHDAVRNWAARQPGSECPGMRFESAQRARTVRRARWALAATAALVLLAVPVWKTSVEKKRAAEAEADARLLEQVSVQLSRPVPASLEPLSMVFVPEGNQAAGHRADPNHK